MQTDIRTSAAVVMASLGLALAGTASAQDARSIALGGSVIANGHGVHGAFANPASMMQMQRAGDRVHARWGVDMEFRDAGDLLDTYTDDDNENLLDDIEDELDALDDQNITCDPLIDDDQAICLNGFEEFNNLTNRVLSLLRDADGESLDLQANGDLGMAFTGPAFPFALHFRLSGTGSSGTEVADGDFDYIGEFEQLTDDAAIRLGEAQASSVVEVDRFGFPLGVTQPEDALGTRYQGSLLTRIQFAASLATTVEMAGLAVDIGVTPKLSELTASNINDSINREFEDDTAPVEDRFEDSERSENSFTFDVGATVGLSTRPVRLAAVLKNVVPESIKTTTGFEFETTPQLIVGGVYNLGRVNFSADLALNKAKVDNFDTQLLALGVEYGTRLFAVRAGINHDAGRDDNATSLSLGAGLGPLQIGARLSGPLSLQGGAQLSFSF